MVFFSRRNRHSNTLSIRLDNYLTTALSQTEKLSLTQQTQYVKLMFTFIAHGLVTASHHDAVISDLLQAYPVGLRIRMQVFPNIAGFTVQVTPQHQLQLIPDSQADVTITFKHLAIAMLVLTFQESTAQAFANDRMTVDGDIAYATRFVRILNQLQALILPKAIAQRAIKRYPDLSLKAKVVGAGQIYAGIAKNLLKR